MTTAKEVWSVATHEASPYDILDSRGGMVAGSIKTTSLPDNAGYEVLTSSGNTDKYSNLTDFLNGIGGSLLTGKVSDTIGFETYGIKRGIKSISVKSD